MADARRGRPSVTARNCDRTVVLPRPRRVRSDAHAQSLALLRAGRLRGGMLHLFTSARQKKAAWSCSCLRRLSTGRPMKQTGLHASLLPRGSQPRARQLTARTFHSR